jgi:hypothetical protein
MSIRHESSGGTVLARKSSPNLGTKKFIALA